jgi:uncharacterized lipoprotein YmbA
MRWIAFLLLLLLAGCASTRPVTVTAVRHTCGDVSVSITLGE